MLEAGMVLSIEPRIYIPYGEKDIPKKYWGIDIRIKDNLLVTKDAPEVLSRDAPKTIEDIENLMHS